MSIFRSEQHREGFTRLRQDYEAMQVAMASRAGDASRLLENTFVGFEEQAYDELLNCFNPDWINTKWDELEELPSAGSLEAFFELADKYHDGR